MMSALYHEEGASLKVEILQDPEITDFIDTHAAILDSSFEETQMSDILRQRLKESDWMFSGMKTFHELNEAFPSLLDDQGKRKPFEQFLNDVRRIDETYNRNYLRAEYNFAQGSAEMAARWEDFGKDEDDYYLQYRTAGDNNVRPEHAALNGVTLPMSDKFWKTYYPPNGWNCRCTVVQVLKERYKATDPEEAMSRGAEVMTNEKTAKMFAFNSGIEQRTFPAYNPYTISRCATCDKAKLNMAFIPNNQVCQACMTIQECEKRKQYHTNREEYKRFLSDKNYIEVDFDKESGGVKATHIGHEFHDEGNGGLSEKNIQNAGFRTGHVVILGKEGGKGIGERYSEGTWDHMEMEVARKNTGTENNVLRGLKHCAAKRITEVAILDYPLGNFDEKILSNAIRRYRGLESLHDGQYLKFKKIICVQNGEIIYEIDF